MLVSNGIVGDSRVQKSAKYFANNGFDTTLIGWNNDASTPEVDLFPAKIKMVSLERKAPTQTTLPFPFTTGYPSQSAVDKGNKKLRQLNRKGFKVKSKAAEIRHRIKRKQFTRQFRMAQDASRELPRWVQNRADWRRDFPFAVDVERQFVPALVEENPDVIYAHDYTTIGAACEAAYKLETLHGKRPVVIYDAHEYAWGLAYFSVRERRGLIDLEQSYIDQVDGIITVSPILAKNLHDRYGLSSYPTLVLNVPMKKEPGNRDSLRSVLGLGPDTKLLVHTGRINEPTGIPFFVDCMDQLPDIHLALVAQDNKFLHDVQAVAKEKGFVDRLHHHPFVPPDDVPELIASADLGILPRPSDLNTDLSLPNKLFEYIAARLPILTSDNDLVAEWVSEKKIGFVFKQNDSEDLRQKLDQTFEYLDTCRQSYSQLNNDDFTWQVQCQQAVDLVRKLYAKKQD